jgi:hypothetical protein
MATQGAFDVDLVVVQYHLATISTGRMGLLHATMVMRTAFGVTACRFCYPSRLHFIHKSLPDRFVAPSIIDRHP